MFNLHATICEACREPHDHCACSIFTDLPPQTHTLCRQLAGARHAYRTHLAEAADLHCTITALERQLRQRGVEV